MSPELSDPHAALQLFRASLERLRALAMRSSRPNLLPMITEMEASLAKLERRINDSAAS